MKNQEKWLEESHINTQELRARLKYCIGKDTVRVYRDEYGNLYCYHYGALICVLGHSHRALYNSAYFDYSAATSRVRNEFFRMLGEDVYTTQYIKKCIRKQFDDGTIINRNIVGMTMRDRSSLLDTQSVNTVVNQWTE